MIRILVVLGILFLVAAVVVQILLWTDVPRGIVVLQLEKQLGLRLTVKSFSTGWLGNTQLNDVTIALPLADKAFLDVPAMKVKNTSLFGLMLGQGVEVQAIELDQPHLSVWQDGGGRWNLQEVAELLARAGGAQSGQQSAATSSTPQMPNVRLVDGVVSIIDNKNGAAEISPLSVIGERDTAVSWKYDIQIPPRVSITGRLVPGGTWEHEVAVKLQDLGAWATPWMADFPPVVIDATWRGQFSDTGIGGRLDLKKATVGLKTGSAEAYGALSANVAGGVFILKPENLLLKTGQHAIPQFTIASGAINYLPASSEIKTDQLLVNLFGGPARVSTDYNLNTSSGRVDAAWEKLALPGKVTHSGSFSATIRRPFPNQILVDGNLNSTGDTPSGPWTAAAKFAANGESFSHFGWTFDASKFRWDRRDEGIFLDGLTLSGDMTNKRLAIQTIKLPRDDLLSGSASYEFTNAQSWAVNLRGQHWPFHPISGVEMGFEVSVRGGVEQVTSKPGATVTTEVVRLDNFLLKSPDGQFSANGQYALGVKEDPLDVNVAITNAPADQVPAAGVLAPKDKILSGTIDGHARLFGDLGPTKLHVKGSLEGREIDIRGRHLGQVSAVISDLSHIDSTGVFIFTDSLKLFGGNWDLDGIYLFDSGGLNVDVAMNGVQLKDVAAMSEQQGISGAIAGKLSVFVPGLHPDMASLQVPPSTFTFKNLQAPGVSIEQADATIAVNRGMLLLNPIHISHGEGRGMAYVALNLKDLRHIDLGATISNWPINVPDAAVNFTASVDIPRAAIDLPDPASPTPAGRKLQITAPQIDLNASTMLEGGQLGNIVAHAGVNGRQIDVRAVHMKLLGGRLDGQAFADLDRPLGATAEFTWEKLDFKKLALIFPQLKEMSGEMTGDLRLAPATVPRPREPLALVISNQFARGAWRTVPIQDFRIAAYLGPNEEMPGAGWRVVLEDSNIDPSFIHADKGTIGLWGRFSTHENGTGSLAQLTLNNLDLNTAVHAFDPQAAAMPGKLAGSIMLIRVAAPPQNLSGIAFARMFPGQPSNPFGPSNPAPSSQSPTRLIIEPIYGEGNITLTKTNLLNFGPFAFLYNATNLFQRNKAALGDGNVEFHLERGSLTIEHMRYFNRGAEIRAVATVDQLWNVPNSPFRGTAYITARPLKDLKLPVLSDFDSVLVSLQTSLALTGVRVEGTLKNNRKIGPLGVTDMTDEMQRFLVGDVKKELQSGAGN